MSNDRLWLRCRCGAIKLLAKYWVSKCELWDPINIDAWLTDHALNCGAEAGSLRDDAFTLHTEATLPKRDINSHSNAVDRVPSSVPVAGEGEVPPK